jgi:hypothetical protein
MAVASAPNYFDAVIRQTAMVTYQYFAFILLLVEGLLLWASKVYLMARLLSMLQSRSVCQPYRFRFDPYKALIMPTRYF